MPLARGHFVNAGAPVPMQRELGPPRPGSPWAAAVVDAARFPALQPTAPLSFLDLASGAVVAYAPELVPELPHASPLITYALTLDDDGKPLGRPVPEWTPGADGAPLGPARFVTAGDIEIDAVLAPHLPPTPVGEGPREWGVEQPRALFAARYAPPALAAALAANDDIYARFDALLRTRPWKLFLEGCLDVQGLLLALADFSLAPLAPPPAAPRAWWTALAGGYATLCATAATEGIARFRPTETSALLLENLALLGATARMPNGDYVLSAHATAPSSLAAIGAFFCAQGRRARADLPLAERLEAGDVAVAPPGPEVAEMVRSAAVSLSPDTDLAQARARLLEPRALWPLVAVGPAAWTPHALAHALTTLLAAPHARTPTGSFVATGAAVPFKLLVVTPDGAAPAWLPLSSS